MSCSLLSCTSESEYRSVGTWLTFSGPTHGHYVTVVRSDGKWVMCDDENVEPIEEEDLANYFGDNITGAGYVLFYQAVDLDLLSLGLKKLPEPRVLPPTPQVVTKKLPQESTPITPDKPPVLPPVGSPGRATAHQSTVPVAVPPRSTSPKPAAPTRSSPVSSSSGTPESSLRRESSGAARTGRSESRFIEQPVTVRREPSVSQQTSPADKSKWYSLKKKDGSGQSDRGPLLRQSTATTLNTLNTNHTASTESTHDAEPVVDLSSSIISTQSGTSAGSALAASQISNGSSTAPRVSSQARLDRANTTAAVGGNGYAGGGNLGRKLSDKTGLGKLARSSSSAWKMGFGKKGNGRVEE